MHLSWLCNHRVRLHCCTLLTAPGLVTALLGLKGSLVAWVQFSPLVAKV